jgi:hypothetical protein
MKKGEHRNGTTATSYSMRERPDNPGVIISVSLFCLTLFGRYCWPFPSWSSPTMASFVGRNVIWRPSSVIPTEPARLACDGGSDWSRNLSASGSVSES